MNSLCNQTYPSSNHQIIIVDGNSTDGTPEIVKEYIENLKEGMPEIILLNNPNRYVSQARNIAFDNLPDGVEYIFETVAHATFPKNHLEIRMNQFLELQVKNE